MHEPTRWTLDAYLTADDKRRVQAFTKNEIAYYNALVAALSSRVRTMPDALQEVSETIWEEVAAHAYNLAAITPDNCPAGLKAAGLTFENGRVAMPERLVLLYSAAGAASALHPEVRRAIAREMLSFHRSLATSLAAPAFADQVLRGPVETLSPHDGRVKRHVQLPAAAIRVIQEGRMIVTPYTRAPIELKGRVPETPWNVVVLREREIGGGWNVEFRKEKTSYVLKLFDSPSNRRKPKPNLKTEDRPRSTMGKSLPVTGSRHAR